VKNKVSSPFRIAEFDVMGDTGISREGGIMDVGVDMGVIEKSGAFFRYGELMLGQGKQAAALFLKEKPDTAKKIVDEIMKKSKTSPARVEVGVETEAKE
jgi:recombination protein RecA